MLISTSLATSREELPGLHLIDALLAWSKNLIVKPKGIHVHAQYREPGQAH